MEDLSPLSKGLIEGIFQFPDIETSDAVDLLEDTNNNFIEAFKESSEKLISDKTKIKVLIHGNRSNESQKSSQKDEVGDILAKFKERMDRNPGKSSLGVAKEFVEDIKSGLEKVMLLVQDEDEELEIFHSFEEDTQSELLERFKTEGLQFKSYDKKTGKVTTEKLDPGSFTVRSLSSEQYARITSAAQNSLNQLSETLRKHDKKVNESEDRDSLAGRVDEKAERVREDVIKGLMKSQVNNYLRHRKETENRKRQLEEEKKFIEETSLKKRRIQQGMKKDLEMSDRIRADQINKAERKDNQKKEQ